MPAIDLRIFQNAHKEDSVPERRGTTVVRRILVLMTAGDNEVGGTRLSAIDLPLPEPVRNTVMKRSELVRDDEWQEGFISHSRLTIKQGGRRVS
jgi:hypothetical protein